MNSLPSTIKAEQDDLAGKITKALLNTPASSSTKFAFHQVIREAINSDSDQRGLLKTLHTNINSAFTPAFITRIHEALVEQGIQDSSALLTENTLLTAKIIQTVTGCATDNINSPDDPAAIETRKTLHYVLTSPDSAAIVTLIEERKPTSLKALKELIATRNTLAAPLRSGSL